MPTMANAVRSGEGQLVLRHRWTGVSGFLRGRRRAQLRPQQAPAEADTARVSESRPRRPLAGHVHRCQRRVPHRAQRARTAASRSPLEGVMRRINLFKADLQGGGIERRRSSLRCPPIASGTVPDLVPDIPGLGPEGLSGEPGEPSLQRLDAIGIELRTRVTLEPSDRFRVGLAAPVGLRRGHRLERIGDEDDP